MFQSILLVGCGNMAGAMLEGWLAGGAEPARFTVVDPFRETAPGGIAVLRELPNSQTFDAVLLGVKPQNLGEIAPRSNRSPGRRPPSCHCSRVSNSNSCKNAFRAQAR